ncbi:unnamed protein product [Ceutorhynchus assimilis]|uniref:Uncharacterized protein n=1 Tax=Ceutorhynchus assimilis TaxID=467358 RepID=A0A9N9MC28_9CUCU|nr:unnamed protein product [Ceutorhynchus assimilis]
MFAISQINEVRSVRYFDVKVFTFLKLDNCSQLNLIWNKTSISNTMSVEATAGTSPRTTHYLQKYPDLDPQTLRIILSFLDLVESKLRSESFSEFLNSFTLFRAQRIDATGLTQRVLDLFEGFPDLVVQFRKFLPPNYRIVEQRSEQGGTKFFLSVDVPSQPPPPPSQLPQSPSQQLQQAVSPSAEDVGNQIVELNHQGRRNGGTGIEE